MPFAPGDLPTAAQMNVMEKAGNAIFSINGQTTGTVTILPAGSITTVALIWGLAWNETGNVIIGSTASIQTRTPGGANMTFSDGGTNIITLVFAANGSVTASRTTPTATTWGLRLLVIAL